MQVSLTCQVPASADLPPRVATISEIKHGALNFLQFFSDLELKGLSFISEKTLPEGSLKSHCHYGDPRGNNSFTSDRNRSDSGTS